MTRLHDWRSRLHALETCPWPGPRPLLDNDEDRRLLRGRPKDLRTMISKIRNKRVLVLTGESGSGKSSFLHAGLLHELRQEGYHPLYCDTYNAVDGDPESTIMAALSGSEADDTRGDQLGPLGISASDGRLFEQLERTLGYRAVLILDQFEELIRYQEGLFNDVIKLLADVTRDYGCKIVLSLRSEYEHRLEPLEKALNSFVLSRQRIKALTDHDAVIAEIIASANTADQDWIDTNAANMLLGLWRQNQTTSSRGWRPLGLLHLQAALYVLHAHAGDTVRESHVETLADDATNDGLDLFDAAMRLAISLKLERCVEACGGANSSASQVQPLDQPLVVGTRTLVRRLATQLSSGGYKLLRHEIELLVETVGPELDRLGIAGRERDAIAQTLLTLGGSSDQEEKEASPLQTKDLLEVDRATVLRRSGLTPPTYERHPNVVRAHLDTAPWQADPQAVSSGAMFGVAPLEIAVEELRRCAFAIEWLTAADLVRISTPEAGRPVISLIHDGFGDALRSWATEDHDRPEEAIHRLTAARGETFRWANSDDDSSGATALDGGDSSSLIVNARWRDCEITASFRRLLFLNCDLRGTRFEHCRFEGVVFINCLLDHASFNDCAIVGPIDLAALPSTRSAKGDEPGMPSFVVDSEGARTIAEAHRHYRPAHRTGDQLFSKTSGVPALPLEAASGPELTPWEPQTGGITVFGGRLNSLALSGCTFESDGVLALRHIAGSSLDIVEQSSVNLDVFRAVIRGLTITHPVDGAPDDSGHINVKIVDSVIADTWFGEGLNGGASIEDSLIWQLWNLSNRECFDVRAQGCQHYGLVNAAPPDDDSDEIVAASPTTIDRAYFSTAARTMDFRSVPARYEIERPAT